MGCDCLQQQDFSASRIAKLGCPVRFPADCFYYTGINHAPSGIASGDDFNTVVKKFTDYIADLPTGGGGGGGPEVDPNFSAALPTIVRTSTVYSNPSFVGSLAWSKITGFALSPYLPTQSGHAGQVLTTNGSGTLSWTSAAGGGGGGVDVFTTD